MASQLKQPFDSKVPAQDGDDAVTDGCYGSPAEAQDAFDHRKPPPKWLVLAESRLLGELALTTAIWPWLKLAPHGDGHPVMVLPGLAAGDTSTRVMRAFLKSRGYEVHGWKQGLNRGIDEERVASLVDQLNTLHARSGRKVSLVGWSLGGLYARMLASGHSGKVRCVVTMGTPSKGNPFDNNTWPVYRAMAGRSAAEIACTSYGREAPPVPTTSIFSRSDGMVAWQTVSVPESDTAENIEVVSSHLGLGHHPAVLYALADRLAQAEGQWTRFHDQARNPFVYPRIRLRSTEG